MKRCLVVSLIILAAALGCAAREVLVNSTADDGAGTLRWALQTARSGDVITFNPAVFPPEDPATIRPRSELPPISCGRLTIDASSTGVIIDGSNVPGNWNNGLQVYSSYNLVMGLQIVGFAGSGIVVAQGTHNTIGGDQSTGFGPIGQGNLVSGNAIGVNLCDVNTHHNAILGNLVGVAADTVTPWGNTAFGVFIEDNVHDNVIGPGNIIGSNEQGIVIAGARAVRNKITQNNIHNNGDAGISLMAGGNAGVDAPVIVAFSPESGSVSGVTCANCLVELFSASTSTTGSNYKGTVQADGSGWFSSSVDAPLEGSGLIATATDPQGNTSPFSTPAQGTGEGRILQTGNDIREQLLVTHPSSALEDNRIGGMWNGFWQLDVQDSWMDIFGRQIYELGLTRAALTINSREQVTGGQQAADMTKPELAILPVHDALFTAVSDWGVDVTYTLTFWDKDRPDVDQIMSGPRFQTESEILRYLDFIRFIVSSLGSRVQCYEIWGEPNLGAPGHHIPLQTYVAITPRIDSVIRAINPAAKIQIGATSGLRSSESREYLFGLLRSEVAELADVVVWHPLYGESPMHEATYYYGYPSIVRDIKRVAAENGFAGEYKADEMVWWTHGEITDQPWRYSTIESAKYTARTVLLHLGMDVSVTLGGIGERPNIFQTIKNLCTVMAGHESINMPVEITIDYEGPVAYCAFRYPNGDRMLAVWTDGIAQDEDPGVPATITFPGLTAGAVIGIDVLHGFEQELVFEIDGEDTIVCDLLVKDYPILIRLSGVTMEPDYEETVGDGFHRIGDIDAAPNSVGASDRDGDSVSDDEDYCPDWPGSADTNGC